MSLPVGRYRVYLTPAKRIKDFYLYRRSTHRYDAEGEACETQVWVEFEEGNLQNPIWVGAYWSQPGGESELPKPNDMDGEEQDVQSPVTRKIIKTLKGHSIQLEDKDGEESILIIHRVDDSNSNILSMDSNGIKIVDQFKNIVEMKDSGIRLTDLTENQIEMSDSAFTITAKVALTIDASGQTVEVKGDSIDFTKA